MEKIAKCIAKAKLFTMRAYPLLLISSLILMIPTSRTAPCANCPSIEIDQNITIHLRYYAKSLTRPSVY